MSVLHHEDMLLDLYDEVSAEFPDLTAEQIEIITMQRWDDESIQDPMFRGELLHRISRSRDNAGSRRATA